MKEQGLIAKSALITFLGLVIGNLLGYIFRIIIARMSVVEYGTYSLGLVFLNVAFLMGSAGLFTGITRFIPQYNSENKKEKVNEVIITSILICSIFSISMFFVFFFGASLISSFFENTELEKVLKIFSFAIPFFVMTEVFVSITDAFKKYSVRVFIKNIFEGCVKIILTWIFILLGYGFVGALFAVSISYFFMFLLSFLYLKKIINLKFELKINLELIKYSYPLFLSKFIGLFNGWIDTLMIGLLINTQNVGIYNAAFPTAILLMIPSTCILTLYLPILSEKYSRGESISEIHSSVTKWIYTLNLPLFVIMLFFSKEIILLIFGEEYVSSSSTLIILSIGFMIQTLTISSSKLLLLVKKTKIIMLVNIFSTLSNVFLNIILIKFFGMLGVAIATSSINIFVALFYFIFVRALMPLSFFNFFYVKSLFAALLPVGIVIFLFSRLPASSTLYIFSFILIFIFYGFFLILFDCLDDTDKKLIKLIQNKTKWNRTN